MNFKANAVKPIIHNLKTRDIKIKVIGKDGQEIKGKMDIVNENRVNFTTSEQVDGAKVEVEGKVKKNRDPLTVTGEYLIRALMGVRSVSLTYTTSQGQFLPGYMPETKYLGMSSFNGKLWPRDGHLFSVTATGISLIMQLQMAGYQPIHYLILPLSTTIKGIFH